MPLIALVAGLAHAHDAAGSFGLRPFVRGGALLGGWTTWGPARVEDDGFAYRVCEEAAPGLRDVWLRDDGVLVGADAAGLWTSDDGGCTVTPAAITDPVSALVTLGEALVAVVEADGGDVLLASADELRTWETVPLPAPTDVRSLAADGGGTWWIAGLAGGAPVLVRGAPGTFEPVPLPEPDAVAVVAHGPAPDGVGLALSTIAADGTAALWTWSEPGGHALLADLPLAATGYGCVADRCLVAVNGSVLLGWDRDAPAPVVPEVVEGPARCLMALGDEVWGCTALERPGHFERTADGRTFASEMPRIAVFDRDCPTGTVAAELCAQVDTGTAPEPTPAPPVLRAEGCGCTGVPPGGRGVLLGLALLSLGSRRRGARGGSRRR